MTTQRLPKLNNPEVILWLGSNLLSREPQVDSQIAASVQNSFSLQETRAGQAQCYVFFYWTPFKHHTLKFTSRYKTHFPALIKMFVWGVPPIDPFCLSLKDLFASAPAASISINPPGLMLGNCLSMAHNLGHNKLYSN